MKISSSMTRISTLASSAVVISLCLIQQVQAATGICTPKAAGIKKFQFPFVQELKNPSENQKDKMFVEGWNLNDSYRLNCDCDGGGADLMKEVWIWATPPETLQQLSYSINGRTVYKITDNLAMGAQVFIGGKIRDYRPVPIQGLGNRDPGSINSSPCLNAKFDSGAKGIVELYIINPFTGVENIPLTKLLGISASVKAAPGGPISPVAAEVWMSGTVTVPQSCSFQPSPIVIKFNDIMSNDFKTKGAMPDGFKEERHTITLKCSNISEGVKVNLTFSGAPDGNDGNLLKTNPEGTGIGIRIDGVNERGARVQISPAGGEIPVKMNYNNGNIDSQGTADIYVSPRNTTGKPAAVGPFSATATVNAVIP
ncbi:TPA: fimbrial protein [Serratia fonticola]